MPFRAAGRDAHGIGFYLAALILLAVVPLVIIAGVLVARQRALQQEVFEKSLVQTAVALSVAVDRQLDSYRVMLETLAQADELRLGRIAEFRALSARVAERHHALFISLFDQDGRQLFNTIRPPGEPLPTPFKDPRAETSNPDEPPYGDPTWLKRTFDTAQPVVSDLLYGLVAQRLIFTVNVPVLRDGKVAYVLNAAFTPEVMTQLLLEKSPMAKVLEIGTGCGYQTAVLARLVAEVYTLERIAPLMDKARRHLRDLRFYNVRYKHVDGHGGYPEAAPFDGMLVTACAASASATPR